MFGYATAIRSLSKGRASYSMEPLTFEQVPASVLDGDFGRSRQTTRRAEPKPINLVLFIWLDNAYEFD